MSGPRHPFLARAALVAAASVMLALGPTASYADNAEELGLARQGPSATAPHSPRALYPERSFVPDEARSSSECVGGYRWINRQTNPNQSRAESSLPVPCN